MRTIRLLLFLLPWSLAFGDEKELFEPLAEPDETWDHYSKTIFPSPQKGSGVLHFVIISSLETTTDCLSIQREETDEGNRFYLYTRKVSRDGGTEKEKKRMEISILLSSSLRNLSSAALKFTGNAPIKPKGLDGTSALLFVDSYRKPVGVTSSPDNNSVPARVLGIFEALWKDAEDGSIDEQMWIERSRTVKNAFPPLPWYPTYSEFQGREALKNELEVMREWGLTHQVEYLSLNGFKDSESIKFRGELAESLAKVAPREWKELMKSSGNMHNPKVRPIRSCLDEATLQTDSVQKIDQVLAGFGLKVMGLSCEKLSFATKTGGGLPTAMMHFKVGPID